MFERGEQPCIVDGDGGLVGECFQQIPLRFGEDAGADAVVGVDDADQVVLDLEGDAQDRAQVEGDDAFLPEETLVFLRVGGDDGFARVDHTLDDSAADVLF